MYNCVNDLLGYTFLRFSLVLLDVRRTGVNLFPVRLCLSRGGGEGGWTCVFQWSRWRLSEDAAERRRGGQRGPHVFSRDESARRLTSDQSITDRCGCGQSEDWLYRTVFITHISCYYCHCNYCYCYYKFFFFFSFFTNYNSAYCLSIKRRNF